MKKVLSVLFFALTITSCYAQISTTKIPSDVQQTDNSPYDGSINFLGNEMQKYIGEELYLKGKNESFRKYGYEGFFANNNKKSISFSNIYKCCDGNYSKYSELAGKYFKVLEVIKHPDAEKYKNTELYDLYSTKYYLKLEEKEKKDIVYYEYNSKFETSFPFIAVKYFNKLKELYLGKEYIVRGKWSSKTKDIKTGKIISKLGDKWKCVDLTIEEDNFNLSLILENGNGEQIIAELYLLNNKNFCFTKQEADNYQSKFGSQVWSVIIEGKITIGMTDEMCNLSWGNPNNINETILSGKKTEQWVYADNYLYFDNHVLTAIQAQK